MTRYVASSAGAKWLRPAGFLLSILACSCSGGPGSDVDDQPDTPPVAKAVVVGNAFQTDGDTDAITTTARAGSEVVLTGKESITLDDPILSFTWSASNAAAEGVQLFSRNSSTVSFVVPDTAEPLEFTLTVFDSDGGTDTVAATVNVVPVADPDLFLEYLTVPDTFTVIASTRQTLTTDIPFDVSMFKRVQYTAQNGSRQTFESEPVTKSATWLTATGVDPADPDFVGNPRLQFRIPQLIVDEINRELLNLPPLDPGRTLILERRDIDTADVTVVISATPQAGTGGDPSEVVIFLQDISGADIPAVDQNLLPTTGEFNGAQVELTVPLETLNRTAGGGNLQENRDTARMYYDTIDPTGSKDSLSKWLEANCFSTDVRETYHADAHAVYTNNFDLGFGRDMYVKTQCADEDRTANTTFADGDVASVVVNYPSLEAAGKKLDPVIAVAMEFALPEPPFDPDPTFDPTQPVTTFYVFAPDEITGEFVRVLSADFDNRGEKYVPGNCAVCHGGRPNIAPSATTFPSNGDVGALFLPWDLDSFLYTDSDNPAEIDQARPDAANPFISPQSLQILADLTRANQQDDFKALNEAVLSTYAPDAPVRRLVHYWYHQPGTPEPDFPSNELQSDTFVRDTVPPDWDVDDPDSAIAPRDLYLDVFAQNCRACHTQLASQTHSTFETYAEFNDAAGRIVPLVFRQGVMPLARLTMDRFWANSFADSGMTAADILRTHFAAEGTPGDVSAVINVEAPMAQSPCSVPVTVPRGETVRLNSEGSLFADTFQWQLEPLPGNISLSEINTANTSFAADAAREYAVTLTAANARGSAQAICTIVVENNLPDARELMFTVDEGMSREFVIREELLTGCPDDDPCPTVFGDPPTEIIIDTTSAVNGSVTVLDPETGRVRFQSTNTGDAGDGSFDYSLRDVDGDEDRGSVGVMVASIAAPIARDYSFTINAFHPPPEPPSMTPPTDVVADAAGGVPPLALTEISTSPLNGNVSRSGNVITYFPNLGFVGTDSFVYTIEDSNVARKTDMGAVTITVNATVLFSTDVPDELPDVQTALSNASCLACHGSSPIPGAPSWTVFANVKSRTEAPAQAAQSEFLRVPADPTFLPTHTGGKPFSDTTADPNYRTILRWIEEGARDN